MNYLALVLTAALLQEVQIPAAPRGFGTTEADVVVDVAGVLSPGTISRLNAIAFDLRQKTGGEIAVVTLPDLRGRDVAEIALRIGREWGVGANARVGDRTRNAGVVILLVPKETSSDGRGHIRVEVGRGAEGFIPDAVAGDIQRAGTEFFRRGDYDGGVLAIAVGVFDRFAQEFQLSVDTNLVPRPQARPRPASRPSVGIPPGMALLLFLFIFLLFTSAARRGARRGRGDGCLSLLWLMQASQYSGRRRSGWGGGGFGGGSFGGGGGFGGFGGGGGFSGGGSSGSW